MFGGPGKGDKAATAALQSAVANINSIPLPLLQNYTPEELVQQGLISPEDYQAVLQSGTAFSDLIGSEEAKTAQLDVLRRLQDISSEGGLTAMDRQQLDKIKSETATQERGQRDAILQNAAQKGMAGSGVELVSNLVNQQGSANRAAQAGTDVAAMAQKRALEALLQSGNVASNIDTAETNRQTQIARAKDAIAQFNANAAGVAANNNTQARNDAQVRNLNAAQTIANQNLENRNVAQERNLNLPQAQFENNMNKAKAVVTPTTNLANQYTNIGQLNRNMTGNIQSTVGQLFGSVGGGSSNPNPASSFNQTAAMNGLPWSDENLKEDVEPFDASDFLDKITGYKYKYTDRPDLPEGEHVGVMAQDLEKSVVGKDLVKDTPNGKMVDYSKAGGPIFAALADLNERLKKTEGK